jgi:hypothetical protein
MKEKHPSEERWERSAGFVYFIAAGDPPIALKIGISTERDIKRRFSTIQSSNHEPLTLLGVIRFDQGQRPMLEAEQHEKTLHQRFEHLQRMRNGWTGCEWFTAAPELLAFVAQNAAPPDEHDLPSSVAKPGPGQPGCH